MRILLWGTYDLGKPRTRILREGLREVGATVDECHAPVWQGVEDKSQVTGALRRLSLLLRWLVRYPGLAARFLLRPRPDVVLTSFPGVLDTILVAPLARLRRVPVAWDMFMSLYDTAVLDRRLVDPAHPLARLLRLLERFAMRRADVVFLDTVAHARRAETLHGLTPGACGAVWVGAEVDHFRLPASPAPTRALGERLRVLFYGQFIPLHGIETIVRAARLLRDEPVEWTLIGRGQEAPSVLRMLEEDPLPRLRWIDWVDYADLKHAIADADVCLGIFGTSDKASSVIPNKVFQIVAAGRPLITRDSPAIRELLAHSPPCSYLVPPGDAGALASAIRQHARLVPTSPQRCHAELADRITSRAVGRQAMAVLARAVAQERARRAS